MRLAPEFAPAASAASTGQVLGAVSRRATLLGAAALGTALVGVYAGGALTLPPGHGVLAAALGAIAAAQLSWVVAALRLGARRPVLGAGVGLQLSLAVVWVLARTAGLPGQGVVPVSELDVICLLDELVLAGLAIAAMRPRPPRSSLRALGPCQLAVTLAGATLFAWGGGHVHGGAVRASAGGVQFGAPAQVRYYCHLI